MLKLSLFASATDSRVDVENGILRGVRVITKGEAKGHSFLGEPIIVDDQTLEEVATAASSFADGVPVKLAHGTDIEELVGSIRNIQMDTDCVRGDLYLLKNHESYATIIEMAQTMPSNFGVSISFMNAPEPVKGNDIEPDGDMDDDEEMNGALRNLVGDDIVAYAARVCELYSADLVQAPACNPSLFSIPMSETNEPAEIVTEDSEKIQEIPASELPQETLQEIAKEVGVDASEIETVGIVEGGLVNEQMQVDGPAGSQNDPEGGKEVRGPEGTQNLPDSAQENKKVDEVVSSPEKDEKTTIPAPAELSRNWNAVATELANTRTELDATRTELASVKSDLDAARASVLIKDAQLVELNMLHRAVLSVMNLGASIEIPEIDHSGASKTILERYEEMPAGSERLAFFQANRREIERSLAAKLN